MQHVEAVAVKTACTFQSPVDIANVRFERGVLVVTLISGGDRKVATVTFAEAIGFRLLDEGDLLEFWPSCAAKNGWLFLIQKNGWFDQEMTRPGFLHEKGTGNGPYEYFIASQNSCLSILTSEVPVVETYSI